MFRSLASLFFYTRFFKSFSVLGYRRALANQPELIPDFRKQTWLITGATGGIGRAIALNANRFGARVLAVGRSKDKLAELKQAAEAPTRLVPLTADLSLVNEVMRLLDRRSVAARPIDVLINNVGVLLNKHSVTVEGFETSFATNLLCPFALTQALQTGGHLALKGLVINVSSGGMYGSPLKLEPMNALDSTAFDGMAAYAMHKRAQVELTRWWNRQWNGRPTVQVMHPGWVDTAGVQTALPMFRRTLKSHLRTPDQGADTVIWLAENRPPVPADGGIWLDRKLESEHEFSWTQRSAHTAGDLVAYLENLIA
ncbi:MAG: SDR family NAD(P)-dependent oxidoreductase [Wenzhouxiangella sp.]|nr:SDR family NAD(P)-dependent oxidoreductase [Wenzhouxiangella sp.]